MEAIRPTIVRQQELDYKLYEVPAVPIVRHLQILANEGGQTVPMTTGGGSRSTFFCSAQGFYFNKSYLQFTCTPVATIAGQYNWLNADGFPQIRSITAYLRDSGTRLLDIQSFNKYVNLTGRHKASIDEVKTRDKVLAPAATAATGIAEGLSCSNNGTTVRLDNTAIMTLNDEPLYVVRAGGNAAPASVSVQFLLRFDSIKDTILSYDKLFYAGGQTIVFEIQWNSLDQIAWQGTDVANPVTGAGAIPTGGNITDLRLMVATESNTEILAWAAAKYLREGFQYKYRFVTTTRGPATAGTQQAVEVRLTGGVGKRLAKVHWGCYASPDTNNAAYDHDNRTGKKVQQYQIFLNDVPLTLSQLVISNAAGNAYTLCDDFNRDRMRLRGSCIQSRDEYYYNWCPTVDFTLERGAEGADGSARVGSIPADNIEQGVVLGNGETKISFVATTTNAVYTHYLFSVTEKELTIMPTGILEV